MEHHRESRKRLRPWLEKMIVSGECPGLVWDNKEERTFRIPWRHFNNKDWVEKDSKIFMEWAKYTGKFQEGDKVEYPVWKTRLRCALKKIPEIKELPEKHHLEDPDPYRVYQFVDVPLVKKVCDDSDYSTSPASFFTNSPGVRDYLEESLTPPPMKYTDEKFPTLAQPSNVPTVVFEDDAYNFNNFGVKMEEIVYPEHFTNNSQEPRNCRPVLGNNHFVAQYGYENFNISSDQEFSRQIPSVSQNFTNINLMTSQPELPLLRGGPAMESEGVQTENSSMKSLPADLRSVESEDLCPMVPGVPSFSLSEQNSTESAPKADHVMRLILKYGFPHKAVLQENVAANGCRLYFGAPQLQHTCLDEEFFGPRTVTQIEMPDVAKYPEICAEQKSFICELLDSLERGMVLTYKDGDIYAQRFCRTRVFVSDGVSESRFLDRKEKTPKKVFDFSAFKAAFENYHAGKTTDIPKHFFYLTFGQEMKKNRSEPLGRVLIHVQVHHTEAAEYVNKFSSEVSQSFDPVSECDTNDRILQGFKNMRVTN